MQFLTTSSLRALLAITLLFLSTMSPAKTEDSRHLFITVVLNSLSEFVLYVCQAEVKRLTQEYLGVSEVGELKLPLA